MDSFAARQACRDGRYDEVLAMYGQAEPDRSWTCWDYYYYAYALRKTKQYRKGREIARAGMIAFPDFVNLHGIYCWCLYYLYIQKFDERTEAPEDFRRAVDAILKYSQQGPYTPYALAVWRMVDVLKNQPGQAGLMGAYLRRLDPDQLPDQEKTVTLKGRERVIASDRERWYSLMSRILVKEEKYDDCITLCQQALNYFPQLHHDNDIWFSYRIALCLLRQGHIGEGRRRLENLLKYKQHWILCRGLFFAAQAEGDSAAMRRYGASAFLAGGEFKGKVNFLVQFAQALENMGGYEKMAYFHYLLARRVRMDQHWKVKAELLAKTDSYDFPEPDRRELLDGLHAFWMHEKHAGQTRHKGTIEKILPGGKAGFLREYGGNSYYFRTTSLYHVRPQEGEKVTFYVEDFFETGKAKPAHRAVDIEPVLLYHKK